jgi:hypothetical protein
MADVDDRDDHHQADGQADAVDQSGPPQLAQLTVGDGQNEEGAPVGGSQYSSEGEPYELEEYEIYSEMDDEDVVDPGIEIGMFVVDEPAAASSEVVLRSIEHVPPDKEERIRTPLVIRKSKEPKTRPPRSIDDVRPLVVKMRINDLEAVVMFDSGSTTDALSPEFARVADMKIFALKEPITVRLGTRGSRSSIIYGTDAVVKYEGIDDRHYFDIVNVDKYDAIIGLVFMRRFGVLLDPVTDQVIVNGKHYPTLSEKEEKEALVRRYTMTRTKPVAQRESTE